MQYDAIPEELKRLDQWVCWGVDKIKPKMPFDPKTMQAAKAGVPDTWGSYEQAVQRVQSGEAGGVGFEFNNNGYYGVDLDKVIDELGGLTPEAQDVVTTLTGYTELSPSGTELHIIVKANGVKLDTNRKGFLEIYCEGRYFTMTGNIYEGVSCQ